MSAELGLLLDGLAPRRDGDPLPPGGHRREHTGQGDPVHAAKDREVPDGPLRPRPVPRRLPAAAPLLGGGPAGQADAGVPRRRGTRLPYCGTAPASSWACRTGGFGAAAIARHLSERYPDRFRASTLHSTAQNLASSWTQAGYLTGKVKKKRVRPVATPVVAAFAVVLGYLGGLRGKRLLDASWIRSARPHARRVDGPGGEASRQGWLTYKAAGTFVEITFPGLLSPQEEKAAYEPD